MATVHLESLTKRYGPTTAVDDVSIDIADGELLTLLGPSGWRQTHDAADGRRPVEPTAGRIHFDDEDVTYLRRAPEHQVRVPDAGAVPHLSVADNIGFGLSVKGARKDAIRAGRGDAHAGRTAPAMAPTAGAAVGGQQQRVALARVLATDPRVLLFDEPLSALDKNLRDQLKYGILDLQRRTRKTAIYVTHDQSEAFAISDRIVVMNAGRIEQIGTQTEIYLHPRTPFVAEFIGIRTGSADRHRPRQRRRRQARAGRDRRPDAAVPA
jgi:ABC-type Fe3+/spermidine/putrescine transport system ATPase subunit